LTRPSVAAGRPMLNLGARAATVAGSYLATAIVVLAAVVIMRRLVSPQLLRDALSFFFISTLAAGLEPATVKAAVLGGEPGADAQATSTGAYVCAGAVKAVAASPFLAALWAFSDPQLDRASLAWTPLVAIAGFVATDMRVLLDVRGRHALAIWLKQGSLMGGLVIVCLMLLAGTSLFWAVGVSTAARLAWVGIPLILSGRFALTTTWNDVRALLADRRWVELAGASVIAAASGSMDRVLALRYLAPATYGAYFLLYEVFSKFWLLPYLLGPIVFVRRAARQESAAFIRGAWLATGVAGALFLIAVSAVLTWAPSWLARFVGASFGPAVAAFALAIVLAAFTQLRIADLQGSGATRRATVLIGLGAVISAAVFFMLIRAWGVTGLLIAWLIKSVIELAMTLVGGRAGLAR